jgi:hypothetical protein
MKANVSAAVVLITLFATAFISTFEWPPGSAVFPRVVTGGGLLLSTIYVLGLLVSRRRASTAQAIPEDIRPNEDPLEKQIPDIDHSNEPDYVFGTAGRAAWLHALGWIALFLALLWILGLFVAGGLFALTYLRWGAKRTWLFSAIYAAILPGILFALFRSVLFVPTPLGVLTGF